MEVLSSFIGSAIIDQQVLVDLLCRTMLNLKSALFSPLHLHFFEGVRTPENASSCGCCAGFDHGCVIIYQSKQSKWDQVIQYL